MKDENYINIQGWMINKLKLKGNELIVYAIIYGFTQDGESEYHGSQRYIAKAIGSSLPTANAVINKLLDKGLIIKTQQSYYMAVKETLTDGSVKETLTPVLKKLKQSVKETLTESVKETLTNNNNIINNNNNINNSENDIFSFDNFWKIYPNKSKKPKCQEYWKKMSEEERKKVMDDIPKRLLGEKWSKKDGQFIEMSSTYLNNKMWEDDIKEKTRNDFSDIY